MKAVVKMLGLILLYVTAVLPHPVLRSVARASGWLIWLHNGRFRQITVRNLEICFPEMSEDARTCLARQSLREFSLSVLELGRTWLRAPEYLLRRVTSVVGEDNLRAAVAGGNGAVILLPHLGNWELVNPFLAKRYPITSLYREPKLTMFGNLIRHARQRTGAVLVPTGTTGIRALLKALRSGQSVLILPDQVPRPPLGMFAPFFGEPTLTMTLATNLIHRTHAKAVCAYCKRLPGGQYELVFRAVDEKIYDRDSTTALAALNRSIEHCVLECREQYQWEYKRYKIMPGLKRRNYYSAVNDNSSRVK